MPDRFPPLLRRTLKVAFALVVGAALVGATYQGVATALERRDLERPGRLVDVGDHQLHIDCAGEGTPTVVLEAAAGSVSASWAWVRRALAGTTRVCAYDRARLGWSEGAPGGYEADRVSEELHTLLANARERGPIVLVGHELGAAFARQYAARYPAEVDALVLVEETRTGWGGRGPAARPWLARVGLLRLSGAPAGLAAGLPAAEAEAVRGFLNRPDHLTRAARELASAGAVATAAAAAALAPSLPVTTVTTTSRGLPAILATEAQAGPVAAAVAAAVAGARARAAAPAAD